MFLSTVLILLVALDIVVYYLLEQHGDDKGIKDKKSRHEGEDDDAWINNSSPLSPRQQFRRFSLAEIKAATCDFDEGLVIGKGGFGKVYKGTIDLGSKTVVAIKRLKGDSNQGATEFWTEIKMLSKLHHSHIVSLLGYCEEAHGQEMIFVYEYMPHGSLEDHVHKMRSNGNDYEPLTWVQRLNICIGAARGLDYLHTGTGVVRRVIHRDVKSSNILLDENWAGKISDFGLCRTGPVYQSRTTDVYTDKIMGTFGYMDVEYFSTHRLTRKSDVYAFGVVLFEVLCGRPAVDFTLDEEQHSLAGWVKQCNKHGTMGRIIDPYLRGTISANCLNVFEQIAYKCIHRCPKDRPTMAEVVARLELALVLASQVSQVTLIDKAWSLLRNKVRARSEDKGKELMTQKRATTAAVGGDHSGGATTTSRKTLPGNGQLVTSNLKIFTFIELRKATRNFRPDIILGRGGFGEVFKGWVKRETYAPSKDGIGIAVAIKKLNTDGVQGFKEWQAEVQFLGKLRHPNLVKLLGYCWEDKEYLLVYEYMQKGSLDNHLFRKGAKPVSWDTRIKIAMGAAQGLAFLHTTEKPVIYRDFKSSNILLDGDFNAKLSDFGLAKLGPANGESHVSTVVFGTYGYAAPEYIATGHLYVKSDVYGFGVVLLEMITGLRVLDPTRPGSQHNLVYWAKPSLPDKQKLRKIMDPLLEQDYPSKGARRVAKLTFSCLEQDPKNRPSMQEVVVCLQKISEIKTKINK